VVAWANHNQRPRPRNDYMEGNYVRDRSWTSGRFGKTPIFQGFVRQGEEMILDRKVFSKRGCRGRWLAEN